VKCQRPVLRGNEEVARHRAKRSQDPGIVHAAGNDLLADHSFSLIVHQRALLQRAFRYARPALPSARQGMRDATNSRGASRWRLPQETRTI
jgi:hypothetical protein